MPASHPGQAAHRTSRRSFLRALSLGGAALAALALPVRSLFGAPAPGDIPDFPEDSLFRPRPDQLEAMRRGQRLPTGPR
mgnify:CR=1 FL=1